MHIRREARGIAANVDVGALFEPRIHFACVFAQTILHVGLWRSVAGKRDIHLAQNAILEIALPLNLIEEIAAEIAFAEHQPRLSASAARLTLLHESPIRCDAGPCSDHENGCIVVG